MHIEHIAAAIAPRLRSYSTVADDPPSSAPMPWSWRRLRLGAPVRSHAQLSPAHLRLWRMPSDANEAVAFAGDCLTLSNSPSNGQHWPQAERQLGVFTGE
jgi:hypothetical protein